MIPFVISIIGLFISSTIGFLLGRRSVKKDINESKGGKNENRPVS